MRGVWSISVLTLLVALLRVSNGLLMGSGRPPVLHLPRIGRLNGEVVVPGSKSLSNRALLLSALSKGPTRLEGVLFSDDVRVMLAALNQLKVSVVVDEKSHDVVISGTGGPLDSPSNEIQHLYLENAGTAIRLLSAVLCAGNGHFVLDGCKRMRERPIADLLPPLHSLGADVKCSPTGCPPVEIIANQRLQMSPNKPIRVAGNISSQYLSALLMLAPLVKTDHGVIVEVGDELISRPYIDLTIRLMARFGVFVNETRLENGDTRYTIASTEYKSPGCLKIEGDASSASYWLAGAAISGGDVTIRGCGEDSLQGDTRFAKVLEKMGAKVEYGKDWIRVCGPEEGQGLNAVDEDCVDIPDVAMTLAMVAVFAKGRTTIRNVASWRVKETERLSAMVTELRRVGVEVEEGPDWLSVNGLSDNQSLTSDVTCETYGDHRMAMCMSLLACGPKGIPVSILDPSCTSKTYPEFFQHLSELGNVNLNSC